MSELSMRAGAGARAGKGPAFGAGGLLSTRGRATADCALVTFLLCPGLKTGGSGASRSRSRSGVLALAASAALVTSVSLAGPEPTGAGALGAATASIAAVPGAAIVETESGDPGML